MIDIHSHLLPGIDDGPQQLEDAVAMALAYVADGVTHVVATPHVFPGRYQNVRSSITIEHSRFAASLARLNIPLQVSFAGEVRLTPEALDLLALGELPYLGGTETKLKALLLEMPDGQIPLGAHQFVTLLRHQGITPVIAHPERNRGVMERPERMRAFVESGCQLQITAGSMLGDFGSRAQSTAQKLLDAGWVHVVASDAHGVSRRPPRMKQARDWLATNYGERVANSLTLAAPAKLCGVLIPE